MSTAPRLSTAEKVGFRVDIDQTQPDGRRFVQLTPPGSACSVAIGRGITEMAPGSMQFLLLVVPDIQEAWKTLRGKLLRSPRRMV